jgi:hypothetical protein
LIKPTLSTTWGQQQLWVQTGCEKHKEKKTEEEREYVTWQHQSGIGQQATAMCHNPTGPHQQLLHQTETHGSTWLSRVNKGKPRGIHLLVHINSHLTI